MKRALNAVFVDRPTTIFAVMSALANKHGAVNLGQGFPDEDGPEALRRRAAEAIIKGPNQYAPTLGLPALRQAVARANARFYGIDVDWEAETLICAGASEALAAAFLGVLEPGDEAILLAPVYDSYAPMVEAAGARPVFVRLSPPDWRIPVDEIAAAVTDKTKLIAVNTPHNPCGVVARQEELAAIARLCVDHDLIAVCDEVYEHLLFDGRPHTPLMTFPGMRDRAVRIGSAGKTFSMTGWRIGYATAAPRLIDAMAKTRQFLSYTLPPHTQIAVAEGLDYPDAYYEAFAADMQAKRDVLVAGLRDVGFKVRSPEGTYFLTVDIRDVGYEGDDMAFCTEITEKAGVAAVPMSAFYPEGDDAAPRNYARFCFCKKPEVLEEACGRLKAYFG